LANSYFGVRVQGGRWQEYAGQPNGFHSTSAPKPRFFLLDKITRWEVGVAAEGRKSIALSEDFLTTISRGGEQQVWNYLL
jgi:hypothetical protein